ncbi:4'-phosphopantetheinyl transferase superfamily protein [Microcoleus sp. FACHB-1515]|uniref:4'-phosphopantetheinyl transferase superfamily protein n=1 Tax=Cyanophyceae TaxID=3028117 RepID=UPI0016881A1A|nr:4'-phosphopantetheinyl transferase superfamily protein [Microcoleus sp. FACHB-1515]MBD2089188.1 4'-phosphopantetheinyl transferase superfamily protein [Microcoleus sp. FACHB-1515]
MIWQLPRSHPSLSPGQVQVWRVNLTVSTSPLRSLLDAAEQARADRLRLPAPFIASHAALRLILSRYLQTPPDRLQFACGDRGKPFLVDGAIEFNLSHSSDWALIAVAIDQPVGVDVEQIRSIEFRSLLDRYFHPQEVRAIACLPSEEQQLAFFRCWTRKEAYLKAIGCGIANGLNEQIPIDWTIWELNVASNFVGAVAIQGRSNLLQWNWSWDAIDRTFTS